MMADDAPDVPGFSALYRIEGELGSGGMGVVYGAVDLRHDRRVAIKVLRREISATIGAERFLREIRIAAQLTHPHILPLIDSGESDGLFQRVSALRVVFSDDEQTRNILSRLRLENLDRGILGEEYPEDTIVVVPHTDHFELMTTDHLLGWVGELVGEVRAKRDMHRPERSAAADPHPQT